MVYGRLKSDVYYSLQKFYLEFLKMQKLKSLDELSSEDIIKLRNAHEEGKKLALKSESNVGSHGKESLFEQVGIKVPFKLRPWREFEKTYGIFKYKGIEVPLQSGEKGPGEWITRNLPGGKGSGKTAAWTHVEGHATALMHKFDLKEAHLYINQIPCNKAPAICQSVIGKLLPKDSKLLITFLTPDGTEVHGAFTSGKKGFQIFNQ